MLVVLFEGCDLCPCGRGEASLKYVRTGNKARDSLTVFGTKMQVLAMERGRFAVKQVPKWRKVSGELGCKYARIYSSGTRDSEP